VRCTNRAWLTTELRRRRGTATSPFDRRLILAPALRPAVRGRGPASVRAITPRAAHGPAANAVGTIPAGGVPTTIRRAFSTADASEAYVDGTGARPVLLPDAQLAHRPGSTLMPLDM